MTLSALSLRATQFAGAALLLSVTLPAVHAANAVTQWNRIATATTAAGSDTIRETRILAMTHIAIHDALNAIERRYAPYAWDRIIGDASVEAAVATAASDVLTKEVPSQRTPVWAAYQQTLANIQGGEAKEAGIRIGHRAAEVILQRRENDGSARDGSARAGTQPGEYRPTPPDLTPAFLPEWGRVQPFAMRNSQQFRPEPPYKLNSPEYARDYNEVLSIGDAKSTTRSEEGSQIAKFWYEDSGPGWNRIAVELADARKLDNWKTARLLALVNIAMADGFIGGFEAKYHYNFWRPVTAIQDGDIDGNNDTPGNYNWMPYLPTPPVPDYPSTHSVLGAAAARVLAGFFGTDFISFEMTSGAPYPGITRKFWSFSEAAAENAASRVLAGIHFTNATRAGLAQGEKIGDYAFRTLLQPVSR